MKNVNFLYVYIYIVPALLSLVLISFRGTLLGDFRSFSYNMSTIDFLVTFIQFIIPLVILYLLIRLASKVTFSKEKDKLFESFIMLLFLIIFIITFLFGAIEIGQANKGGIAGFLMSLVVKFNPYLLLGLLAFSNVRTKYFIFCLFVCIFYCFKQVSLQGYLISILALITFMLVRGVIGKKLFSLILIFPFVMYGVLFDALIHIYSLRNEMRGAEFDASQIVSLAVGRISSLSSYIYIKENTYIYDSVSDFFSLGIFLERLVGVSFFDTASPSVIFNQAEVGNTSYSIFLGLNGFLFSLYESSILIFYFNMIVLVFVFVIILQTIPFFSKEHRVKMFFLIMYMPILSFDVWEISIVFQSLIFINILFVIYRSILALKVSGFAK